MNDTVHPVNGVLLPAQGRSEMWARVQADPHRAFLPFLSSTMDSPSAVSDPERIAFLRKSGLLDSPSTPGLDRVTRLASQLLQTPIAVISLIDSDRQVLKSHIGLSDRWLANRNVPLDQSLCRHAVELRQTLLINDTFHHDLARNNTAVMEMRIRAYIGIPLRTEAGHTLGCLCVIDHKPRVWLPGEVGLLSELAAMAVTELELEIHSHEHAEIVRGCEVLCETMPIPCFALAKDQRIVEWNSRASQLFGYSRAEALGRQVQELLLPPSACPETEVAIQLGLTKPSKNPYPVDCLTQAKQPLSTEWTFAPWPHTDSEGIGVMVMVSEKKPAAQETSGASSSRDTLQVVADSESRSSEIPKAPLRIWLLDDDEHFIFLATKALEKAGYAVSGFTHWAKALSTFLSAPQEFALAVLDSNQRGPSGLELAGRLRALRPKFPIVVCTAYIKDSMREEARRSGVEHLIVKPATIEHFVTQLDEILKGVAGKHSTPAP